VVVKLVDPYTGSELESRTLERPMGELFALQDELATSVARFLRQRLGHEIRLRTQEAGTRSTQARQSLLRAEELRQEAERLLSMPDSLGVPAALRTLASSDSLLRLAARYDPSWSDPLVLQGWNALQRASTRPEPEQASIIRAAIQLAQRALPLDRTSAALELRGTARWRLVTVTKGTPASDSILVGATQDLRAAVTAEPTRATAWSTLSQILRFQGRFAEADLAARRALEEDAYLADAGKIIQRLYRSELAAGRYDEAERWCQRGHRDFPDDWHFVECQLTLLAADSSRAPDAASAWALIRHLELLDPADRAAAAGRRYWPIHRQMLAAAVLARAGDADSARAVLARARILIGGDNDLRLSYLYDEAVVRLLCGEDARAVSLLSAYLAERPFLRTYVANDLFFRKLWSDPGFIALARTESPRARTAPP
jgi:tetratricopeptide (TPR) repeat protein